MNELLLAAYKTVRSDLLAACDPSGHWTGRLCSSSLATATAVSALAIVQDHANEHSRLGADDLHRLQESIVGGLRWLSTQQNDDGGWGDSDRSESNISATMLVRAAFQLTGVPVHPEGLVERADAYIEKNGGIRGLRRRYGRDKTFAVPILTNYALAGLCPWRRVSALPFELGCLPKSVYRFLRLPVVSYAIPALVAVGLARYHHAPPRNPVTRWLRGRVERQGLDVVRAMQPESGGFLEAIPLTSFVVMSLAASGHADHATVRNGVRFLLDTMRSDGSWPIDTNLSMWVTTSSINALAVADEPLQELACWDWLQSGQQTAPHPFTGAKSGGWAWTDLSGGVPDADDTAGALLALSHARRQRIREGEAPSELDTASRFTARTEPRPPGSDVSQAMQGVQWLLDLQNRDGGWPTFCRGWGKLPFDRSGSDLTAHVIRALHAWRDATGGPSSMTAQMDRAIDRGFEYLERKQNAEGSWFPLWFGNEHHKEQANPVYGTAKVLLAYRDAGRIETAPARRAFDFLLAVQDLGGGWGGNDRAARYASRSPSQETARYRPSSVEETALALESLLGDPRMATDASLQHMVLKGLAWLVDAVDRNHHLEPSPIGFYFAKLWYYEDLYPLIFTTAALGQALRTLGDQPEGQPTLPTRRADPVPATSL